MTQTRIQTTTHYGAPRESPYSVGLDLGQATDFSALAVVEHVNVLPPGMTLGRFHEMVGRINTERALGIPQRTFLPACVRELHVRHLQRWELGTPYHAIVEDVCTLMGRPKMDQARLQYDRSGVGRAVGDLLRVAYMDGRTGHSIPMGCTVTGGPSGAVVDGNRTIGKRDLMAALQLPIQQGRLRVAKSLPLGAVLERELTSFKMTLSRSGHDSYEIGRREGEGHGDLVIAVALACHHPEWGIQPTVVESAPNTAIAMEANPS